MKKFAVGYINAFDNELTIEFHEGATWHEALMKHSKVGEYTDVPSSSLDDAKRLFWNCDASIDVKEVL